MPIAKKPKGPKKTRVDTPGDVETFINRGYEEAEERLRQAGNLIEDIHIESIDEGYFVRDRIVFDHDAFDELKTSIMQAGQKTPIEVTVISNPGEPRLYGLVSGWRRLHAIRELSDDPGFSTIKARVLQHDLHSAMIAQSAENEMRKNISPFERGIFINRAVHAGAFKSVADAVENMFAGASASKKSKIRSFAKLAAYIGDVVQHPDLITEAMGLKLVQHFDAGEGDLKAVDMLKDANNRTKEDELKIFKEFLVIARGLQSSRSVSTPKGRGRPKKKRLVAHYMPSDREVRFEGGTADRQIRLCGDKDGKFRFVTALGEDLSDGEVTAILNDIAMSLRKTGKSD